MAIVKKIYLFEWEFFICNWWIEAIMHVCKHNYAMDFVYDDFGE